MKKVEIYEFMKERRQEREEQIDMMTEAGMMVMAGILASILEAGDIIYPAAKGGKQQ